MNRFIAVGGIGIILAVLAIFLFMVIEVGPLFLGAEVQKRHSKKLGEKTYSAVGMDEWGVKPFLVGPAGTLHFVDLQKKPITVEETRPFGDHPNLTAFQYHPQTETLLFLDPEGRFAFAHIQYQSDFSTEKRKILHQIKTTPFYSLFPEKPISSPSSPHTLLQDQEKTNPPSKVLDAQFGEGEDFRLVGGILEREGNIVVRALRLDKEENLLGEGTLLSGQEFDLTKEIEGTPEKIRINESGDVLLVSTMEGKIYYFHHRDKELSLRQVFEPFADETSSKIASMDFLLGGVSVFMSNPKGTNFLYSLYIPKGGQERLFGRTKSFSPLPGPVHSFSKSLRNKAFLVAAGKQASLRYGTTAQIRWEEEFPQGLRQVALNRKYNRIAILDQQNQLEIFDLSDPHPEGGWKAFFGKIWYEGAPEPAYAWQSTGGSDAFESKLSLIPLIIGTLKGTFYALIFAIPIALLAALYTSQFLHPNLKKIVKPVMEIMASLPSVILGFLAALWLAPLIEDKVPSLLMVVLWIPVGAFLFGFLWERLPNKVRARVPEGQEWLAFIPIILALSWLAWELGPLLERWAFVAVDPTTGERTADFRLWWTQISGTPFEQRNSLVVGFIMGFAVIPIIFTISEDSLSAVPTSLRSASLALGASRWQTAYRIILPAASAGIFSAIMIGFGRAVGETMIVLMATGNTPLLDFNIFTGMRTLSANLAVELPEAPFQGTLYRTLFLGALLLFLMTFSVNSVAEIMRQRIRKKFKGL